MRRYPQGAVRGAELALDEKGQSASSGGSRRHPACCASCSSRTSGTPAHWHISTGRVWLELNKMAFWGGCCGISG